MLPIRHADTPLMLILLADFFFSMLDFSFILMPFYIRFFAATLFIDRLDTPMLISR